MKIFTLIILGLVFTWYIIGNIGIHIRDKEDIDLILSAVYSLISLNALIGFYMVLKATKTEKSK